MKTITTDELKALREKNGDLTLVNTLGAESFEKTQIPGAVNIPLDSSDFASRVEKEAGGKDKSVVVLRQLALQLVGKGGEEIGRGGLHSRVALHGRRCRVAGRCCGKVRVSDLPRASRAVKFRHRARHAAPARGAAVGPPLTTDHLLRRTM